MRNKKQSSRPGKRIVNYYDNESCLVVDGVRIQSAREEYNRNFTESSFVAIPNRDPYIERLLMITSAMLVDYHYHRREEDVYRWSSCEYRREMVDENPQESEDILLDCYECCRMILEKVFQGDWMSQTRYVSLVIFLMFDICQSLKDFKIYLALSRELENMVSSL